MIYTGNWNRDAIDYQALLGQWHVVCPSLDVGSEQPKAARLLGNDLVLWRDDTGQVHAWQDYCGHRGARLSLGHIKKGEIECPYHGWRYNPEGQCTRVPAHPEQSGPASQRLVYRHLAQERYGYIWVSLKTPQRPYRNSHNGMMSGTARFTPGHTAMRRMRYGRLRTLSTPHIFHSSTPTSMGCRMLRSR